MFAYAHIQKKVKTLASRKHPEIGDLRSGIYVIPLSVGTINGTERLLGIGKLPEIKTKCSKVKVLTVGSFLRKHKKDHNLAGGWGGWKD